MLRGAMDSVVHAPEGVSKTSSAFYKTQHNQFFWRIGLTNWSGVLTCTSGHWQSEHHQWATGGLSSRVAHWWCSDQWSATTAVNLWRHKWTNFKSVCQLLKEGLDPY